MKPLLIGLLGALLALGIFILTGEVAQVLWRAFR